MNPKNLTGVKIIYTRKNESIKNPGYYKDLCYEYSYNGFHIVENDIKPDFSVPFKISKDKDYYLLVAIYHKDYMISDYEENLHLMLNLFENIEHAKAAVDYLIGNIIPTQHKILQASEKIENFNGFDKSIHSYSIDCNGEICIIENFPWTKIGQSISYNNRTEILENIIIQKVKPIENVDLKSK